MAKKPKTIVLNGPLWAYGRLLSGRKWNAHICSTKREARYRKYPTEPLHKIRRIIVELEE